ncbi:hypothetical protein [Eisenbergiella sp.]
MKINKFFVIILVLITLISPLKTYAAEKNIIEGGTENLMTMSTSNYVYTDSNGYQIVFPTLEDYEVYVKAHEDIQPRYGEQWILEQTLHTSTLNHYFVGYHSGTPNWTKASSYVISQGKNFSIGASYPWQGITLDIGFSYSFSVATTIPANANKYSRLGVYADYTLKQEKYAEYQYGIATGNTRVSTYAVRTANYIDPVYQ